VIPRYAPAEMARLWADEGRFEAWLRVELAACDALAARGVVPATAAASIRERARIDVARIDEIESEVQHDVIAFVSAVAETVGPEGRWLHYGLTSSDVVDTALALLMRDACDLVLTDLDALTAAVRERAKQHRETPMIGRTHGVHAEPMTFGLKLASWYTELLRGRRRLSEARHTIAVGKLSGAVGTFSQLAPDVEADVCAHLGLRPAAVSSQILQRDRHAEVIGTLALIGSSLEKFATEIRALQKTEVREVEEPFARGQKGSSAMPHKRNPIGCEQVTGLARVLRGNAMTALANVALWHERDISHSSAERVIVPDSFCVLSHMLRRMTRIVSGMHVAADRMRKNLDSTRGLVFSGHLLSDLTKRGMRREDAYRVVQSHAMAALEGGDDLHARIVKDAEVRSVMKPDEIAAVFDLNRHLRHVGEVFDRALAEGIRR